ncbi:MAG: tRNA pseudouridine(55) synthase TruB [Chloroflexota bacterium]|nr:tRNA pseudouridine(55) synthase TruB [Chloroflexota bacterium]
MKRADGEHRHGYLVIDKEQGWTSHDVVARVRRLTGVRRVGHAGTLDPAAIGVLPVAVGNATKTIEYLSDASKAYDAEAILGVETDTYDTEGAVVARADPGHITRSAVEHALATFRGEIDQLPPMHSAVHVGGKRLYHIARQGQTVDRPLRSVTINRLEIVDWQLPSVTLHVDCSKGTYIRTLAHDLGEELGVGAMLAMLVRTRSGPFVRADAMSLTDLARQIDAEPWSALAYHPDVPLRDLPAVVIDHNASMRWRMGQTIELDLAAAGLHRVYDQTDEWLGIGVYDEPTRRLQPRKVIGES